MTFTFTVLQCSFWTIIFNIFRIKYKNNQTGSISNLMSTEIHTTKCILINKQKKQNTIQTLRAIT